MDFDFTRFFVYGGAASSTGGNRGGRILPQVNLCGPTCNDPSDDGSDSGGGFHLRHQHQTNMFCGLIQPLHRDEELKLNVPVHLLPKFDGSKPEI